MTDGSSTTPATGRLRRQPPAFRRVTVLDARRLSPRLAHVTLHGDELEGFRAEEPAASVRLLLPQPGAPLVIPEWNGNEFLLPGGHRPAIRTFTPRRVRTEARELDLEIVLHGSGAAATWAAGTAAGDEAAVSGPGRGYRVDPEATGFLLAGDETAVPAISQLLEALPAERPVEVHVEVAAAEAEIDLPHHPVATVRWHVLPGGSAAGDAMAAAIRAADIPSGTRIWVAGEAAGVHRIRRHLFDERGITRADATVRGYWKHGRTGEVAD